MVEMANIWVRVQKVESGKYIAAVGKEIFDGGIKMSLVDGKIMSSGSRSDHWWGALGYACTGMSEIVGLMSSWTCHD